MWTSWAYKRLKLKQIRYLRVSLIESTSKAEADQIPESIFDRKYKFNSINSSSKKGQSGVALYTDIKGEAFSCDHVDILDEGRINEYHFGDIAYFNVYFPNGQRNDERLEYKMAFYERFLTHINALREEGKSWTNS